MAIIGLIDENFDFLGFSGFDPHEPGVYMITKASGPRPGLTDQTDWDLRRLFPHTPRKIFGIESRKMLLGYQSFYHSEVIMTHRYHAGSLFKP